jgi:hypothetical protein
MKKLYLEKEEPWKDMPPEIIEDQKRRKEEEQMPEIQPTIGDIIPYNPPKKDKEKKKGVIIIKMC